MKKQLIAPKRLTKAEQQKLDNFFYLPGWQFEALIGHKCTELSTTVINWAEREKSTVKIYGLRAVRTDTGKECIANFFVHYDSQVYQFMSVEQAAVLVTLIKKDFTYTKYKHEFWEQKRKARELAKKLKQTKIQVAVKKAA